MRAVTRVLFYALLTADGSTPFAESGLTYRFRADTVVGRVWVAGDHARRELEDGEGGTAKGRVEIWKSGGKQIFVLDPVTRTYYERNAFLARSQAAMVSVETLTARRPFQVRGVEHVEVGLRVLSGTEVVEGHTCRRAVLTFSYEMKLLLEKPPLPMPAAVQGSQEFCLMLRASPVTLPFGHRVEVVSGHAEVDAAIAARLASLQGIPVTRLLKVTRRIDDGAPVSASSAFVLSDLREVAIEPDRFEVPKDYTFREPEVVPPVRKPHHQP